MSRDIKVRIVDGVMLGDQLTLADLSRVCTQHAEWVIELVEEGILEPRGKNPREWLFTEESLVRAHKAMRIQRDLQVNLAGVAVVLDLMEQVESLRARLRCMGESL